MALFSRSIEKMPGYLTKSIDDDKVMASLLDKTIAFQPNRVIATSR
jgi:hypothetical protein